MLPRSVAPKTARSARLFRLATKLQMQGVEGAPKTEADKLVWVNSHIRYEDDKRLSLEEEHLRAPKLPIEIGDHAFDTHGSENRNTGDIFHFRDFPMFPGEYIPPGHDTLRSMRSELRMDLAAQSLKEAWMKISKGRMFNSVDDYYAGVDGLDEKQLTEVVSALYPTLNDYEATGLVRRVLETLSHPNNTSQRKLANSISAEAIGMDHASDHYTNFVEWMGRLSETKAFKAEQAIYEFCRRKFNREDVRIMYENMAAMSEETIRAESADSYSIWFSVLKDYSRKISATDTRPQIGVRIDPPEINHDTGASYGMGKQVDYTAYAELRENKDRTGTMTVNGKPIQDAFRNEAWQLEKVLMPFDEASLDFRDFDVAFTVEGQELPEPDLDDMAPACRMAVASAISKMMPITRIPLKKSGMLDMNRKRPPGEHPGFIDGQRMRRKFRKR